MALNPREYDPLTVAPEWAPVIRELIESRWRESWAVLCSYPSLIDSYPLDAVTYVLHLPQECKPPHYVPLNPPSWIPLIHGVDRGFRVCPSCFNHAFTTGRDNEPTYAAWVLKGYVQGFLPWDSHDSVM